MTDQLNLDDIYGMSKAPHLKAADNEGFNKAVKIKAAAIDEVTFPNEAPKKGVIIDIGAEKPIWLSRTNASTLTAEFGKDLGAWVGRKILLQTKGYSIDGKNTVGWVTFPMPESDEPDDDLPM